MECSIAVQDFFEKTYTFIGLNDKGDEII